MVSQGTLGQFRGVHVGHAQDPEALTGCTAVLFLKGAVCGHAARGVATGSRELAAVEARHVVERIHGICLCGGSAYGLAAASGVMEVLEERGVGHLTGSGLVPIVPAAVIYDLHLGAADVRPDHAMGRQAARAALAQSSTRSGNVGAGMGATAGKLQGAACATKTGVGLAGGTTEDGLQFGALVVANPVGDILHPGGQILAGTRKDATSEWLVDSGRMVRSGGHVDPLHSNTTLGLVLTDAKLSRIEAAWVAEQAAVGLGRSIEPPFTRHDGDVVFAASVGSTRADLHRVGLLCREALRWALVDACRSAEPAGGLPSCHGLLQPEASGP